MDSCHPCVAGHHSYCTRPKTVSYATGWKDTVECCCKLNAEDLRAMSPSCLRKFHSACPVVSHALVECICACHKHQMHIKE